MSTTSKINRTELTAKVNQYIISCIDTQGYDVPAPTTDQERVNFVVSCFEKEYLHNNEKGSRITLFAGWLQGLPSSFNIDFENYRILEIAREWGTLTSHLAGKEDAILNNWWNYIANKFFQLHEKLNRPAKTPAHRKTKDVFNIMGRYGATWEVVTAEETRKEALAQVKCYRENEPGTQFKIEKKREKIVPATK